MCRKSKTQSKTTNRFEKQESLGKLTFFNCEVSDYNRGSKSIAPRSSSLIRFAHYFCSRRYHTYLTYSTSQNRLCTMYRMSSPRHLTLISPNPDDLDKRESLVPHLHKHLGVGGVRRGTRRRSPEARAQRWTVERGGRSWPDVGVIECYC